MTKKQKTTLYRIIIAAALFVLLLILEHGVLSDFFEDERGGALFIYLIPYLVIGHDIILKAVRNIGHGQIFDENFLMVLATAGAFAVGEYSEALAVMLFYQVGELFQSVAVGKSRDSIAELMEINPEYANVEAEGKLVQVDPDDVESGTLITVLPGERIPIDGIVEEGESMVDTSSLTGEAVPVFAGDGDEVISGCVNGDGLLKVRTTKDFDDSTVTRILELVEDAETKKARVENFITRFAKYYTPVVTVAAAILAVIPPLFMGGDWSDWIQRACVFLVISCPCALVISVPMGFFGGIGAASKNGILVKGGNYLEALSQVKTLVMDKTGTITEGRFRVTKVLPAQGRTEEELLETAALIEGYSTHPIAMSICAAFKEMTGREPEAGRVSEEKTLPGKGVTGMIDGSPVMAGNRSMLEAAGIDVPEEGSTTGTVVFIAINNEYAGSVTAEDEIKAGMPETVRELKAAGIEKLMMLTGDGVRVAEAVAEKLNLSGYEAELLPQDKVLAVEELLKELNGEDKLAFVGDGINDAPVLARADVGVAMGSMGSDAAIEAADIVIMDDDMARIPAAMKIARKTMRIVKTNIVFALAVKFIVLILGALGIANMWLAVFADVGVAVLCILNSMRTLNTNYPISQGTKTSRKDKAGDYPENTIV